MPPQHSPTHIVNTIFGTHARTTALLSCSYESGRSSSLLCQPNHKKHVVEMLRLKLKIGYCMKCSSSWRILYENEVSRLQNVPIGNKVGAVPNQYFLCKWASTAYPSIILHIQKYFLFFWGGSKIRRVLAFSHHYLPSFNFWETAR